VTSPTPSPAISLRRRGSTLVIGFKGEYIVSTFYPGDPVKTHKAALTVLKDFRPTLEERRALSKGIFPLFEEVTSSPGEEETKDQVHVLHPAGGLTADFVYEPLGSGQYVYKTKAGERGLAAIEIEYDDPAQRNPHRYVLVEGVRYEFVRKPPKEWLFQMPQREAVERWIAGEKQSQGLDKLWTLNGIYLRTFLDFPHPHEFSVTQLFVFQSWLQDLLSVAFYLGVKGEYGGGKTVTGEAVMNICHHGYMTGNTSPPFVARAIQEHKVTLLADELDSFAGTADSDLNSIFRQGYRRGVKYSRVNPETLETESYDIFRAKLFTVHAEIEEALQTRTIPIHVRETNNPQIPIVNMDKGAFAQFVYTENFLWYMDNILAIRGNEFHLFEEIDSLIDLVDLVDVKITDLGAEISDIGALTKEEVAEKIREKLYKKRARFVSQPQLNQLCQLAGRNVELMYICFALSNLIKVECDDDIERAFEQKVVEEGERTEIGYLGVLREVLIRLWQEKHGNKDYLTEAGFVKISNKETYEAYIAELRKAYGEGVSPTTFKEHLLEFGFTDALNRTKLKVPIPSNSEPQSRLCNIFTGVVLRKLGNPDKLPPPSEGEEPSPAKPTTLPDFARAQCELCGEWSDSCSKVEIMGRATVVCPKCKEGFA